MPHRDAPPLTRGVVLRAFGVAFAVVLGGFAAWLIVTSSAHGDAVKRLELGMLAGFWSAIAAAFAMFGSRRLVHPHEAGYEDEVAASSAQLALRAQNTEFERAEEAAARRAHEARLEHLLRNEIRVAINREVGALRAEIAELRSELLEKVGGQLRLERIETTRVIGSDLEALQHEVRQLKAVATAQDVADLGLGRMRPSETAPVRHIVEPARVRPVSRETAEVEAVVQPARMHVESEVRRVEPVDLPPPVAPPPPPPPAAQAPPPPPAAQPPPAAPVEATGPLRVPEPAPVPRPQPAPPAAEPQGPAAFPAVDDFAALPRIRPFTDFELDPIEDEPAYTGRRRADEPTGVNGRHAQAEESGRRHGRADDDDAGNDLLAKLLAREGMR
jgi:hypothetical protein